MTAEAPERPPTPDESGGQTIYIAYNEAEAELRLYSPDEVYEKGLLPIKPGTLRLKANRREIPHNGSGAKITFGLRHIRAIQDMHEIPAMAQRSTAA